MDWSAEGATSREARSAEGAIPRGRRDGGRGWTQGRARVAIAPAPLLLAFVSACGPADAATTDSPLPPAYTGAFDAGLGYLESTDASFGADVLVLLQVITDLTGDARPATIAAARRGDIDPAELAVYQPLLDVAKPALSDSTLDGVEPSASEPDPAMLSGLAANGESLVSVCLERAVLCRLDDECLAFALEADRWGYVLTHQAAWLLFRSWMSCDAAPGLDADARRRELAASLVKETRADPGWTDLAGERLGMLGQLGFGSALEPVWIGTVLDAQEPEGCWRMRLDAPCHAHPTVLGLWALAVDIDSTPTRMLRDAP